MAKAVGVLLVEDNPSDVVLLTKAFERIGWESRVTVAQDGIEALEVLHGRHPARNAGSPDLIVLDLNLPRMNGKEVLASLRQDPLLARIPLAILTSARSEDGTLQPDGLADCAYFIKPWSLDEYAEVARQIREFWRDRTGADTCESTSATESG